jgi:hypothetical protein
LKLERTLELERSIQRWEADVAQQPQQLVDSSLPSSAPIRTPLTEDMNLLTDDGPSVAEQVKSLDEPPMPLPDVVEPSPEKLSNDNAVIILPEQPPTWLQQAQSMAPDRLFPWHDRRIRVSLEMMDHASIHRSHSVRSGLLSFGQLVGAAVLAVALYVGIAGWVQPGRQPASDRVTVAAPPASATAAAVTDSTATDVAHGVRSLPLLPRPEPQPVLAFPLPKTYGVYAGSNGQLTELQRLPIKIPDSRVKLSAEIREPGGLTVASGKVAFVVFRRDLVNSAPQTASVRVVAHVARAMRFVNGKAIVTPIEGVWRIRSKAYEFKISPLEGHREMIVIQPDSEFVFPAGRYALVLNGYGYEFTVPGSVTAPEQCLEQAEMLSGTVLSECAKS